MTKHNENHLNQFYDYFNNNQKLLLKFVHQIDSNVDDKEEYIFQALHAIIDRLSKDKPFEYKDKNSYKAYFYITLRNVIYLNKKNDNKFTSYVTYREEFNHTDEENCCDYKDDNPFDLIIQDDELEEERIKNELLDNYKFNHILQTIDNNETPIDSSLFKYRFAYSYTLSEISKMTNLTVAQIFYRTDKMIKKYKNQFEYLNDIELDDNDN